MKKKRLKVLHLASFAGNIGDNANHMGFKALREDLLTYEFDIRPLEIREFYWKERSFASQDFIDLVNEHDLFVIGGGNYFELWVEDSATGTSIDLDRATLEKLTPPIFFHALGLDPGQGIPQGNIEKFQGFLDLLLASDKYFVSLRNDGAMGHLKDLFGPAYAKEVYDLPDNGFYMPLSLPERKKLIAIQLAGDMLDTRFNQANGHISYDAFIEGLGQVLSKISEEYPAYQFEFIPHIFRDLKIIYDLINVLPDPLRRRRVTVAPYLTGDQGAIENFKRYASSSLVLGMRFHANVCPLGLGCNLIGLKNYLQIEKLYEDIGSKEYVLVNQAGFEAELLEKMRHHLENEDLYRQGAIGIKEDLYKRSEKTYKALEEWLNRNFKEE